MIEKINLLLNFFYAEENIKIKIYSIFKRIATIKSSNISNYHHHTEIKNYKIYSNKEITIILSNKNDKIYIKNYL